ncbi:MAG: zinc metallopeptidase [Ruminococcaceae bacterium]|nr:zinc metallopeptidase [Oscillospiraceae bacterium]
MFWYTDWTYIVLVLPAVILALIAQARVNSVFTKYSKISSKRGFTGAQAARRVLDANGLSNVRIERVSGKLTDHYDPRANVIRLSDATHDSTSAAAIGVAAHEAGHAVQHATGYLPIKVRAAIIPLTNIGSRLAVPLIILGIFLSYYGEQFLSIAYLGVIAFSLSAVFQLVTLPTEFNASRRALEAVENYNVLDSEEIGQMKKVLSAAAMTYVAALAVSLTQLLRLLLMVNRRRR